MSAVKRIFLVGFMASGKTTSGKRIAEKFNLDFIDLDVYIENRFRRTVSQIFAERGEEGFRKIEHNMLEEVAQFEDVVIAAGGGTPCFFDNMQIMNDNGETVYLKGTPEMLCSNLTINGTAKRPLVAGKSKEELIAFISETLAKREPFYAQAKHTIQCDDFSDTLFEQLLSDK
ncbi:MAG: shikimate kinase [Paludibacteraceae bacterium]|nr:shikimate kinase [Candidatus Physcocola equi]MCQ2234792.1 shikimate kinase [Paludibacteraceae bacterium]